MYASLEMRCKIAINSSDLAGADCPAKNACKK